MNSCLSLDQLDDAHPDEACGLGPLKRDEEMVDPALQAHETGHSSQVQDEGAPCVCSTQLELGGHRTLDRGCWSAGSLLWRASEGDLTDNGDAHGLGADVSQRCASVGCCVHHLG